MLKSVRVMIYGRVQGVGYRAWTEQSALAFGLNGWVRNRLDGSVEAVFSGEAAALDRMLLACRQGPRMALVERIEATNCDPPESSFRVLPTG